MKQGRHFFAAAVILMGLAGCAVRDIPETELGTAGADYYLQEGYLSLRNEDYGKAIAQLTRSTVIRPDFVEAHNLLGMAYFFQKNYKEAEERFQKAISLSPTYASAHNNLGGLYFMTGKLEKAKGCLMKALSLSPDLVSANYSLGSLLLNMGDQEGGLAFLSKGIDLDPSFLDTENAFVTFSSATGSPEIYFTWARVFASKGNLEKTVDFLEKARKMGFKEWTRIDSEKEFESIRMYPEIRKFLKE